ncbi:MAG: adenylate cyclase regulatory domain-containing protein [Acidimicrobiales bacterium]
MTRTVPEVPQPADARDAAPQAGESGAAPTGDAGTGPAWVPLLALDRQLFPAEPTYTTRELAAAAGVDVEVARRLWRAMGFTPAPDDAAVYGDDDLAALRMAANAMADFADMNEIVYQTRMMAASLSRVAEVVSDNVVANLQAHIRAGMSEEEIVRGLSGPDAKDIDRLIGYVYRRQLQAALWRKLADPGQIGGPLIATVGFVDLVRFTAVTEDIAEEQLGELIDRFETIVYDRVTDSGGRVVKMIGDEVMFVADEADQATAIAVDLVRTFHDDESVPQARAGLAHGPVLSHGGDFFGPVVNLASRIVDVARPSTVVVSQDIHDVLADRPEFCWRRLPPKRLKGIGRTTLFAVAGQTST